MEEIEKCTRCIKDKVCTKSYIDRLKCVLRKDLIKPNDKKFLLNQKKQKNMRKEIPHKGWDR